MTTESPLTKQGLIISEIRAALIANGPLSTTELVPLCETAEDGKALSRIIYELRNSDLISIDPRPGPPGRDGRPAKRYRWIGPDESAVARTARPKATAQAKAKPTIQVTEPIEDESKNNGAESFRPALVGTPVAPKPAASRSLIEAITAAMPTQADKVDATELTLADLVDQADEALLAYADSLLADDPVWKRIRRLADETHGALCDYRLMRSLEANHA